MPFTDKLDFLDFRRTSLFVLLELKQIIMFFASLERVMINLCHVSTSTLMTGKLTVFADTSDDNFFAVTSAISTFFKIEYGSSSVRLREKLAA